MGSYAQHFDTLKWREDKMGKYDSLASYLKKVGKDRITLSFEVIEKVIEFPLPRSARIHSAWWGNHAGNPQASWVRAGFKVHADLDAETCIFIKHAEQRKLDGSMTIPQGTRKRRKLKTVHRMENRINKLIRNFDDYLRHFENANLFTGPCQYFHIETVRRLRNLGLDHILNDRNDRFYQLVYGTLVSWGMHRMGKGGAKMIDFEPFRNSIVSQKEGILSLQDKKLSNLGEEEIFDVRDSLWGIIDRLKVSSTKAKLVANSKTLHHILPNLVPPMDREYTLNFFYGNKMLTDDEVVFKDIYPKMYRISTEKRESIKDYVNPETFNSSETKIIDNVIVGFVLKEIKGK